MPLVKAQDPVCGMDVDPNDTPFKAHQWGVTYFFCSQADLGRFQMEPEKYVERPVTDRPSAPPTQDRSPRQENL